MAVDQNKRNEILKVAKKLFAEAGYEKTSVRKIVDAANTSMGNLYFHFPTKHAILKDICQEFVGILRQQIAEVNQQSLRPELGFALDFRIGYITTLEHPKTSQFWVAARSIPEIHQFSLENKRIRLRTFFGDRIPVDEIQYLAIAIQGIADGIFDEKRRGSVMDDSSVLSNHIIDYSLRLIGYSPDEIQRVINEVDHYVHKKKITIDKYFAR
jgi:AcrR family transcriptional regulator